MHVRRGGGRWLMVLACLPVAALVLATTPASANGAPGAGLPAAAAGPASPGTVSGISGFACVPSVQGPVPVTATSQPFQPVLLPALPSGWVDQEFFVSCSSPQITYTTSVYVRRPANPHRASGIVVVEPLHAAGLFGVQTLVQPYLVANGDEHVGIAANFNVVEHLVKPSNPGRYATLGVPNTPDAENQILAGVGAVLHQHPDYLLPDIRVRDAILGGWSGSTIEVRNFISSPGGTATIDGRRVYDGYFPAQAAVGSSGSAEVGPIPDVGVPVIELQGERELLVTLHVYGSIGYRRPDSATYRLYEVPAMAHVTSEPGSLLSGFVGGLTCDWPSGASPSMFSQIQIWEMALDNLVNWVSRGIPAPHAARIELQADGKTVVRDANGNALGGVRTVFVDVPTATIVPTSLNPGGVFGNPCAYVGYQLNFSQQKLQELYGSHGGYVRQVVQDAVKLVGERWLLPENALDLITTAARSDILTGNHMS